MKEEFMKLAIEEAKKALEIGEIPVGAVMVYNNKVIATAHNLKEKENCSIKHAEIILVEKTSRILNNWRLEDCELYVTLEPCPMCAGAISQSRIKKVYAGLKSSDVNNTKIITQIFNDNYRNAKVNYTCGYFSDEINKLLRKFFEKRRKENQK